MTAAAGAPPADRTGRGRVLAWSSWDWGTAAFNVVVTTFVFTVYLTSGGFVDPALREGSAAFTAARAGLSSGLGAGLAVAGLAVALLAPVAGRRADVTGRRSRGVLVGTVVIVAAMLLMTAVTPRPSLFWPGVALVAVSTVAFEVAAVHYNALLLVIATPRTIGRISAVGWASGYVGGILLLVGLFLTLIPQGPQVLGLPGLAEDGLGIRLCVAVAAVWTAVFTVPLLRAFPDPPRVRGAGPGRLLEVYRRLGRDVARIWRTDRNLFAFLVASAVFRDGLTGVFSFGAVIAATVFGFGFGQVVVFGIAANLVAGFSTLLSGRFDDRFGPRRVILVSLVGLVATAAAVFVLRHAGASAFWIGGLTLCAFVGPAQSASRSFLGRLAPAGATGELFGLYATTGRAATFLAPAAFSIAIGLSRDPAFGILGIVVVLVAGLVLLLPVRDPVG